MRVKLTSDRSAVSFAGISTKGPYFTGRFGAGFLVDVAGFAQDEKSKQQIEMHPDERLRDFRFILGGKLFPKIERSITWSAGIMYDWPNHQWLIRQTGVMVAVPELWGDFFIGRTKEGFSLNKVMAGYDGWTMERSTISDASIPILADGIKWLGYLPKHKFIWNVGYFNDMFSNDQSFSTYSSQVVVRLVLLPILSEKENKVLHLGVNFRCGKPAENKIRLRSRPEAFPAPYFIDTGSFQSDSTRMVGYEAYYRPNRWLFGSEYWWVCVSSKTEQIRCSTEATSLYATCSMMRLALTTPSEGTLKPYRQSARYSKEALGHGNSCFDTPTSTSKTRTYEEATLEGSLRW